MLNGFFLKKRLNKTTFENVYKGRKGKRNHWPNRHKTSNNTNVECGTPEDEMNRSKTPKSIRETCPRI
ncbi:CLUMA_CG006744, isoform A [Clunio marinus]|uniref:CLUMA_CG006744, isoform A n=1 Tax=Clunio marinus TaxID=568069 RepID=A0A1J1HYL9_9DIPT|nr:CLUMA_CG006744, isoform A [Clunio marinus]